jgi:hypothetical protein
MSRVSGTAQAPWVTEEGHLLHLLERPSPLERQRRGSADQEQRTPRREGVGHAGHRVGHARPRHHRGHPEAAGQPRVGVSRVRGGLLVAHVDDADAFLQAGVVDGEDVPAAEREEVAHALAGQHPPDQLAARDVAHGRERQEGGAPLAP